MDKKNRKVHRRALTVVRAVVVTLCTLLILGGLQRLVVPKYMGDVPEGSMTGEYYLEMADPKTAQHDVIILGDCEVYENISTETLWEEYGIRSYIRGNPKQTMWQSYGLLQETLKYETPKVVILSVFAMQFDAPQSEIYNRMMLDSMRWSKEKAETIRASMTEKESFLSYVFPVLRYHERWNQLTEEDFTYFFQRPNRTIHGYLPHYGVKAAEKWPQVPIGDENFGPQAYEYLDKIRLLCEENGITLILIKAPSLYPTWYEGYEEQIEEYARSYELSYYNYLEMAEDIGIDYSTDTYDGGLHLNDEGAKKLARAIGQMLMEKTEVTDQRDESKEQ